jgi:murein DD-endopeptidase MepM/ murein hydrolase activator NlpD
MRSSVFNFFYTGLLFLVLSSCQNPSPPATGIPTHTKPVTRTPALYTISPAKPSATATIFKNIENIRKTPTLTLPFLPTISLPTPVVQPGIDWRPPLYPVPWAMSPFDHFYFMRPIAGNQKNWPDPDYRYGGIFFEPNQVHTGLDIPAAKGTPVFAAGSGRVVWAGWGLYTLKPSNKTDPYGLAVVVLHDFGFDNLPLYTVYAHLDRVDVILGQWLQAGDKLGLVGKTGFTTGPHLHFEIRVGENTFFSTRNPELWLVPPQGWGVLAARLTDSYDHVISDLEINLYSEETGMEWTSLTYPDIGVINDPYYQENLVFSDLPSGSYKVSFRYLKKLQEIQIQILPGQVSYFFFNGSFGFGSIPPLTEKNSFFLTPYP